MPHRKGKTKNQKWKWIFNRFSVAEYNKDEQDKEKTTGTLLAITSTTTIVHRKSNIHIIELIWILTFDWGDRINIYFDFKRTNTE